MGEVRYIRWHEFLAAMRQAGIHSDTQIVRLNVETLWHDEVMFDIVHTVTDGESNANIEIKKREEEKE